MKTKKLNSLLKSHKYIVIYLFPIPLILNLIKNILDNNFIFALQNSPKTLEFINLLIGFLLFIFYLNLGIFTKNITNLKYITTNIVVFWTFIFAIDNTLLFFTKSVNFDFYLYTLFITFLIFGFYKKAKIKHFIYMMLSIVFLQLFIDYLNNYNLRFILEIEEIFTSDERRLWYPVTQNIFENNYYSALTNNPFSGYGLFTSYVSALNSKLVIFNSIFSYALGINYLFIFLFFLFLFEISKNKITFLILTSVFLSIILTSSWFTYVFFGSLLSEAISSYCFGVLFTEIHLNKKSERISFLLLLFSFGFLYFTRQFISVLVLIYLVYLIIRYKNLKFVVGFIPLLTKIIQSRLLPDTEIDPYINSTWLGNIYFNFGNIIKTFNQFFIDKPLTYLVLMFVVLSFLYMDNISKNYDFYVILILNTLFVFILMVFLWTKSDVQSSYRYILNVFYLMIYPLASIIDYQFDFRKN